MADVGSVSEAHVQTSSGVMPLLVVTRLLCLTALTVTFFRASCGTSPLRTPQHPMGVTLARQLGSVLCVLNNTQYHASPLERTWSANVKTWGNRNTSLDEYCKHLAPFQPSMEKYVKTISKRMSPGHGGHGHFTDENLSYFELTYDCGDHRLTHHSPIEPLAAFLRHPQCLCVGDDTQSYLGNLDYLMLASAYSAPYNHQAVKV